jgi:glycine/D-amino acid oxidase-like deaminating enzyme
MRVVVLGAGIVGTTTAYRLKRRYPDIQLRIVAEKLSPHTTSDIGAYVYIFADRSELSWPLLCNVAHLIFIDISAGIFIQSMGD